MKKNAFFKAGILLLSLALLPGMVGCGAISSLMATPTPTPMPTNTPTPTSTSTPTQTPTPLPTPTPKSFAIQSKAFDEGETCFDQDAEMEIYNFGYGAPYSKEISVLGNLTIINGKIVLFCYGAKHTWKGNITYAGYTFASDPNDPLQFQVTRDKGYVYIKGKGTVTMRDGTVVELP
jgi:hypothetical protein